MQNAFTIKGTAFGAGRPVTCVPVTEKSGFNVVNEIRRLVTEKVKMIEWRVDCLDDPSDVSHITDILSSIKPVVQNTVLLFTFRTKKQGGMSELDEKTILRLNEAAAESGVVDIIDLEFFEATNPRKEIRRFQDMGVRIIASHHDFEQTPDNPVMNMLIESMQDGGADIVKLAVMPNSFDDVLRLMSVTDSSHKKFPTLPIVTISMGKNGLMSRLCGELFGSCITFGTLGKASAPGQVDAKMLDTVLDIIHEVD